MAAIRSKLDSRSAEFDAPPPPEVLAELHHKAHDRCFIANSVKTEVLIEAR